MQKWLLIPFITFTALQAKEVAPEEFDAIYTEAIWFVLVFGVMGIVSYIYSSRHAVQYTKDQADNIALDKLLASEEVQRRDERLLELSKLVEDGVLKEEEFRILRASL